MTMEIKKTITEVESEAEQIKRQALADARLMVSEAREQAYLLLDQSVMDAEEEVAKIMQKAEKAAESEIEKLKSITENECGAIREQTQKKLDNAADIILGRIVKTHGNR